MGVLIMTTVGINIRKRREELSLTQEELAKKLNYKSKSTINKIEMGINDITQSKVVAFAQALNTTPAYLMGWEDTLSDESTDLEYEMSHDKLLRDFYFYWKQLSDTGKKKIIDNVSDLAKIYKNDTE